MSGNIDYDNKQELSWLLNMFHWNSLFFRCLLCGIFQQYRFWLSIIVNTNSAAHSLSLLSVSFLCFLCVDSEGACKLLPISITAAPPTALGPDTFGPPWIHHLCLSIHLSMFPLIPPCFPSPFLPNSAFSPWLGFCSHGFRICIHQC